jgi:hypothetical protein
LTAPNIVTPKGAIIQGANGKARLEWNTTFRQKWQGNYSRAQMFVDSEILRLSEPYTPLLTSMLIKSGTLGTDIGSGTVEWIAPYAKAQYYGNKKTSSATGALRGGMWFERGKAVWGRTVITGAKRFAGGG